MILGSCAVQTVGDCSLRTAQEVRWTVGGTVTLVLFVTGKWVLLVPAARFWHNRRVPERTKPASIGEAERELEWLRRQMEQSQNEYERLREENAQLKRERDRLRRENERLSKALETAGAGRRRRSRRARRRHRRDPRFAATASVMAGMAIATAAGRQYPRRCAGARSPKRRRHLRAWRHDRARPPLQPIGRSHHGARLVADDAALRRASGDRTASRLWFPV